MPREPAPLSGETTAHSEEDWFEPCYFNPWSQPFWLAKCHTCSCSLKIKNTNNSQLIKLTAPNMPTRIMTHQETPSCSKARHSEVLPPRRWSSDLARRPGARSSCPADAGTPGTGGNKWGTVGNGKSSLSLSIYLSIDLSIYRSIDLSIYRSIDLSIYRSIYLFIYLPLSIYLSIYLSLSLCVDFPPFYSI